MSRALGFVSIVLGLVLTLASPVAAQSMLPLEYGRTWELEDLSGGIWRTRVSEQSTLNSRSVWVLKRTTPEGRIWNYWSEGSDGTVRLHAFFRPDDGVGAVYDPPLEWIRPDLSSGLQWQTQATASDFVTGNPMGTVSISIQVGEQDILHLARGDFMVWPLEYGSVVGKMAGQPLSRPTDLLGDAIGTPDNTLLRQEYAADHGLIRETVCCPLDVRVLKLQIVPTRPTRWGELKSHYRE